VVEHAVTVDSGHEPSWARETEPRSCRDSVASFPAGVVRAGGEGRGRRRGHGPMSHTRSARLQHGWRPSAMPQQKILVRGRVAAHPTSRRRRPTCVLSANDA
jgi:hypothetical protein